jgi:hypothetical protein
MTSDRARSLPGALAVAALPALLALMATSAAAVSPAAEELVKIAGNAARPAASGQGPSAVALADERLDYRWRVQGLFGAVAGLFFPSHGEGQLTRKTLPNGNLESELWITSGADDEPDFFRYGAETSVASGTTIRAWSSQLWRGKRKEKSSPVAEAGVIDVASAIQRLRTDRPAGRRRMEIWSDGKLYPVEVRSLGNERLEIAGRKLQATHVAVRPLTEPDRRVWKGELDLWFADDAASTPVRILVSRSPARVLLELERLP